MDDTTPSPWPAPTAEAAAITSVVVTSPPKKSRTGLIAGVGVLAVAAVATGTFLLVDGDATPTYALDRAAAGAAAAHGAESHIITTVMGQTIEMDGETNRDTGTTHFNMDLGSALGFDAQIEAIVDAPAGVMYLSSDFLAQFGGSVDTKWVKLDKRTLTAAGQDASIFDQIGAGNTLDPVTLMEKAKSVKDLGFDSVEGEKVKHFEVTIDLAELAKIDASLQQQLDQLEADLPDTVVYDMFVTEANELRRILFELEIGPASLKVDTVQHPLTVAPIIEIPSGSEVTDIGSVL